MAANKAANNGKAYVTLVKFIRFRNREQYRKIKRAAKEVGMNVQEFMLTAAEAAAGKTPR